MVCGHTAAHMLMIYCVLPLEYTAHEFIVVLVVAWPFSFPMMKTARQAVCLVQTLEIKAIFQDLTNLYMRHLKVFPSHPPAMFDNYRSVWRSLLSVVSLLSVLLKFVVIYQATFELYISIFHFLPGDEIW